MGSFCNHIKNQNAKIKIVECLRHTRLNRPLTAFGVTGAKMGSFCKNSSWFVVRSSEKERILDRISF